MNVRALWLRVALLVPVVLILLGVWVAARWFLGGTFAEYPSDIEMARAATRLAPDNPQAHFTLGVLNRKSFLPDEMDEALRGYEQATSLSPNDYRVWQELGRTRAQTGDLAGGESALRRAVELAPAYAEPRWHLGNILLREGKETEAFAELQRAGGADPALRPQVMNLAWRVYNGDVDRVVAAIGTSVGARAELIGYFITLGRLDDALRFWSSFSASEKREQHKAGENLMVALASGKRYQAALAVYRDIGTADEIADMAVGRIANGGFEEGIRDAGKSLFGWQIPRVAQTRIGFTDGVQHSGDRSLLIIFNEPTTPQYAGISQLVVVEPQASYRLQFWVRIENLKSGSTLVTEVVDATDPSRMLAASEALPNGSSEWRQVTLEFSIPARTEAVTIRINRQGCGEAHCPIFGKVWYDDFDLQRSSGGTGSSSAGGRASDTLGRGSAAESSVEPSSAR